MKILDIDMDYFLKEIPKECNNGRLDENDIETWSNREIIQFLEKNLGLTEKNKIPCCIVEKHHRSIKFLDLLIAKGDLKVPFEIIHVDSHSDLGTTTEPDKSSYMDANSILFKYSQTMKLEQEKRKKFAICNKCYAENNFLLYIIAFGWVNKLTYCINPNGYQADYPPQIVENDHFWVNDEATTIIQLDKKEKKIPFKIIKTML